MKDKAVLVNFSEEELKELNQNYKEFLMKNDLISRSEFIRRMVVAGSNGWKNGK